MPLGGMDICVLQAAAELSTLLMDRDNFCFSLLVCMLLLLSPWALLPASPHILAWTMKA